MLIELSNHQDYGNLNKVNELYEIIIDGKYTIEQLKNFSNNIVGSKTTIQNGIELMLFCNLIYLDYDNLLNPVDDTIKDKTIIDNFMVILLKSLIKSEIDFFDVKDVKFKDEKVLIGKQSIHYKYYALRNLLISESILISFNDYFFEINSRFLKLFESLYRKISRAKSLEQLKKEIENNEALGEKAELFVLEYERKRFSTKDIRYVSPFDVGAGYDIVSYQDELSETHDKFIEVKCVTGRQQFYWSINEIKVAQEKRGSYFLYLVDSSFSNKPIEIRDPYDSIYCNSEIQGEVQSIRYNIRDFPLEY